jgi:glycosyltransferase involved in cell wall biosynthesis
LKILHLVQNYFPSVGGIQTVAQQVSEGCVRRYHDDVTVFTTNALNNPQMRENEFLPLGDELVNDVHVRRFGYWRRHRKIVRAASRYAKRVRAPFRDVIDVLAGDPMSPAMWFETLRARVDVIGTMAFPYLQMYYPLYARPRGPRRPVVLYGALHLDDDHVDPSILRATSRAQAYIAFTEFERQVLIRNGIPAARVHVIGLGVEVDRFLDASGATIRARYGIGDVPVVGFIGRHAQYKGCDTLIKAMTTVWDRFPEAHLILAGSRTAFSDQLDALVAALPPAKRARVTIEHDFSEDDKPQWFAACDIVASVSSRESFGIVYVEAWACGKPVIGGRIGAVECVIRDGEDGLLVPCADPPALASAIESLLADDAFRERLGRNGRDKVLANHQWSIVVDRVRSLYERVASEWHE